MTGARNNRSTLIDVARLAGVHVGTASRALDPARHDLVTESTRRKVEEAAQQLGYRVNAVARSLRRGQSGLLGVVVADVANPFLPPILRGIEDVVHSQGMFVLIVETHDEPGAVAEILENLVTRRVDAVILSGGRAADAEAVERFADQLPLVMAVRNLPAPHVAAVVTHDDALGAELAMAHLASLGHRRVAQLPGPPDISSFAERRAGFRVGVAAHGLVDVTGDDFAEVPTVAEGHRLAGLLLDAPPDRRPTALFAHNDLMAVGCVDALTERGLTCPRDVSVVGYNDAPLSAHLSPALTTVRLPSRELGVQAATLVLATLRGDELEPGPQMLVPELVVRESTAPARS